MVPTTNKSTRVCSLVNGHLSRPANIRHARTMRRENLIRYLVVLFLFATSSLIVMMLLSTARLVGDAGHRLASLPPISDLNLASARRPYNDRVDEAAKQRSERHDRPGIERRRRHATFVVLGSTFSSNTSRLTELLVAVSADDCRRSATSFRVYKLYAIGLRGDVIAATASDVEKLVAANVRRNNCSSDVVVSVRAVDRLVAALNSAALDAYVDHESDHFRLVFAVETSTEYRRSSTGTQLDAPAADGLFDNPKRPPGIGLVLDYSEIELLSRNSSVKPCSMFFEAEHMEIFGWMLPPVASSLQAALGLLLDIYDERNLTARLTGAWNSTVMRELHRGSESWRMKSTDAVNSSGSMLVELQDTIDR